MTLQQQIERTLEDYPETRNSDITLMIRIWETYYSDYMVDGRFGLDDLYNLPREDNIKRIRARIQNVEKRLLPTSEEVVKKRRRNVNVWRTLMGYKTKAEEQNAML